MTLKYCMSLMTRVKEKAVCMQSLALLCARATMQMSVCTSGDRAKSVGSPRCVATKCVCELLIFSIIKFIFILCMYIYIHTYTYVYIRMNAYVSSIE